MLTHINEVIETVFLIAAQDKTPKVQKGEMLATHHFLMLQVK